MSASPEASFLVNPNSGTALSTAWASVKLSAVTTPFANSRASAGGVYLSDLELDLDTIAGGATSITAMLTYDSAGSHALAGPTVATTFANLAGALGTITFAVDQTKVWPSTQTVGECYLWLKLNAGTANLSAGGARLHWRDPPA